MNRRRLFFNTVEHPQPIRYVTLQPGNTNGYVFVSSFDDGILHLFDIRRSVIGMYLFHYSFHLSQLIIPSSFCKIIQLCSRYCCIISVPVFETAKDEQSKILSPTFFPVDAMLIASVCQNGANLFDIRQNSFRYNLKQECKLI
jgi:hypothetical protein